ncbi:S66 peptidase family protein [Burkholderia ambifaria]|uniref:S66 peptidase family protein n=1 Tax=Burkholderia ambifaria TaxID=152480 RepID=UPI00158D2619|nr:LD-carboxypeptidase [Burkholderia ambifaria]
MPDEIATPKTIIGFSDATSLFCALADRQGVRLLHGPTFHSLATKVDDATRADIRAVLTGDERAALSLRQLSGASDAVRGRLCGGNVTVLASVAGTRWSLRSRDAIVLLEDVTEFGYRLDRSLTQLRLSGAFDGARAFVLGQFTRCPIPHGADFTLEQMLVDVIGGFGLPIYSGLPIGHEHRNITWQYGGQAAIENGSIRFRSCPSRFDATRHRSVRGMPAYPSPSKATGASDAAGNRTQTAWPEWVNMNTSYDVLNGPSVIKGNVA